MLALPGEQSIPQTSSSLWRLCKMNSRRAVIRRLIFAPAGAGLSLLAMVSLAGCDDHSDKFQPRSGNRDDPKAQRDIEIPPGIPNSSAKSKTAKKTR
jgi:hypothetical protein